jgi:uncharacterized protein YdeI (YjbR/CyaY-like superfamily)
MQPAGLTAYEEVGRKPELIHVRKDEDLTIPDDLLSALKINLLAYNNFLKFPPLSRKLYILWLNDAKRPETRLGRIAKIVERSEKNIKAGIM